MFPHKDAFLFADSVFWLARAFFVHKTNEMPLKSNFLVFLSRVNTFSSLLVLKLLFFYHIFIIHNTGSIALLLSLPKLPALTLFALNLYQTYKL